MQRRFLADPEALLGTVVRLFAAEGKAKEVAILTYSTPEVVETDYDNWNGGTTMYTLFLHIPISLYTQIQEGLGKSEQLICDKMQLFIEKFQNDRLTQVKVTPALIEDPQWRERATNWLKGGRTNQGRVRSDNVAPLSKDGLLFRSQPEIFFYQALKNLGVSFAPLPVFIRGGETYSRIEPDFFIIQDGITMVVEIDGDTVHQETPAEAHARTSMLQHEGVHMERIRSSECETPEKACKMAKHVLGLIQKMRKLK